MSTQQVGIQLKKIECSTKLSLTKVYLVVKYTFLYIIFLKL